MCISSTKLKWAKRLEGHTFLTLLVFRMFFRLFLHCYESVFLFYSVLCELLSAFAVQIESYNCEQLYLIQIFYTFRCN